METLNKNMDLMFCTNCGSNAIDFADNVYTCQSCGSKFEKKQVDSKMFVELRLADTYRQATHFEDAKNVYKKIIQEYPDENLTDVYWGLFLCEQNVIFEEDGKGEKFPSFYRINPQSVEDTPSYLKAITYASKHDKEKVAVFDSLGEKIEYARKMYLDISSTTNPFEVFICFKNTDENGNHTPDRQLAMDIYNEFSGKYSIFFSEKTLKNIKSNYREYEPNIYYGLYTAKVMLLICSKNDYIESKWLKNEWSRFTQINANKEEKKCIIPIFMDGYDPNDLPGDLASIQGIFDDRKLISNLDSQLESIIHPVDKFEELKKQQEEERLRQEQKLAEIASNISNISRTGGGDNKVNNYIDAIKKFLELGNFPKVKESIDLLKGVSPNIFECYWYSLLYDKKCKTLEDLAKIPHIFNEENYQTAKSFATTKEQKDLVETLSKKYTAYVESLTQEMINYFGNGNYTKFVSTFDLLGKFETVSFEYKFFEFIKNKGAKSYHEFAILGNILINKDYLAITKKATTEAQKKLVANIELANKKHNEEGIEKFNNELAKNDTTAKLLSWYKKLTESYKDATFKGKTVIQLDILARSLYFEELKNLEKYVDQITKDYGARKFKDTKSMLDFYKDKTKDTIEMYIYKNTSELLEIVYKEAGNSKIPTADASLIKDYLTNSAQFSDINAKENDIKRKQEDFTQLVKNDVHKKAKHVYDKRTKVRTFDIFVCLAFVSLLCLGTLVYLSSKPIVSDLEEQLPKAVFIIIMIILGLCLLGTICSGTFLIGIPLVLLAAFIIFPLAELFFIYPISMLNLGLIIFFIVITCVKKDSTLIPDIIKNSKVNEVTFMSRLRQLFDIGIIVYGVFYLMNKIQTIDFSHILEILKSLFTSVGGIF